VDVVAEGDPAVTVNGVVPCTASAIDGTMRETGKREKRSENQLKV